MASQKTSIALYVQSTDRSVVFYEALLGVPPGQRTAVVATFDLDSPPLTLVVAEQPNAGHRKDQKEGPSRPGRTPQDASGGASGARFTLIVNEPRQVGAAAVALRRAGARLWLQDSGLAVCDPDENSWLVRWVPSAPARAVLSNLDLAVGPAAKPTSHRTRRVREK